MKIKNILFLLACIAVPLYGNNINDDGFTVIESGAFEEAYSASQPLDIWTFEVENKTKRPFNLQMTYADSTRTLLPLGVHTVQPASEKSGFLRVADINPTKEIEVTIDYPSAEYRLPRKYTIKADKSRQIIALTMDNEGLKPAKSTGYIKKQTASGLPLANNVKDKDIIKKKQ